jgi:hypothetical protein
MFRVPVATRLAALAVLFALAASPVPAAGDEAFPLDPPERLSEESGGIGSPAVVLRPDGGMIAVWSDIPAGDVVGRWFSPVDQAVGPANGRFVLSSGEASFLYVALARSSAGSGDRYLAVWPGAWPDYALSARPFDGTGTPLGEVRSVAPASFLAPALAARPGGGFVLAYWEPVGETFAVRYRLLSDDGTPLGSVEVDQSPAGAVPSDVDVAVDLAGSFTLSWSWREPTGSVIAARSFSSAGSPLGPRFVVASVAPPRFIFRHALAAVGTGELLAVWAEEQSDDLGSLWARHFHPDGSLALQRRVDVPEDDGRHVITNPSLAATPDGRAVAAWSQTETTGVRVLARLLDADAGARSEPFDVAGLPEDLHFFNGTDVDRDPSGRLAFGWGAGFDPGVLPTGLETFYEAYARRFLETDEICGPILSLDFRTEPVAPTEDDDVRLLFEGYADCGVLEVSDWFFDPALGGFRVGVPWVGEACGTLPPFPIELPVDVGRLDAGDYPVVVEMLLPDDGICSREFGFTVAPGEPTEPPPPPDVPPLTSDALPGFDVWVVISAGGVPVVGSKEAACIPETLCVSGRLPGRSEVFVRVIGPRPNGRLWPTLVKFTTSKVEVWIEQVATGEVEYYVLEEARPGFDELPGLFDREGFPPETGGS